MSNAARKYIADYCKKNDLSASAFEHQVGTSKDAIYSFLTGKVTDLKLSTAIKIADALSISLDELVERQEILKKFLPKTGKKLKHNHKLAMEIFSYVNQCAENNKNHEYSFRDIMYATNEIYEYSAENNLNCMDKKFAEWFCKNQMHSLK